jgi:ATP phosphoribosyltransferase regulatory subunit
LALPNQPLIEQSLKDLERLIEATGRLSNQLELSLDLADLRGYQYHSGVMFAAYVDGLPQPIARGGRYDHVGQAFGRSRPATGFSLDLLTLADLSTISVKRQAILAPWSDDLALNRRIDELRAEGEVVIQIHKWDEASSEEFECQRELVKEGNGWKLKSRA